MENHKPFYPENNPGLYEPQRTQRLSGITLRSETEEENRKVLSANSIKDL